MERQAQRADIAALQAETAFIGIRRVCEISGFSKATILRKIAAGTFPEPVIREKNVTRWDLAECLAWREDRIKERAERNSHPEKMTQAAM